MQEATFLLSTLLIAVTMSNVSYLNHIVVVFIALNCGVIVPLNHAGG
jgi:hypothetical protein